MEARPHEVEEAHAQEGQVVVVPVLQPILGQLAEQARDVLVQVRVGVTVRVRVRLRLRLRLRLRVRVRVRVTVTVRVRVRRSCTAYRSSFAAVAASSTIACMPLSSGLALSECRRTMAPG